jgi:hypothetical protein
MVGSVTAAYGSFHEPLFPIISSKEVVMSVSLVDLKAHHQSSYREIMAALGALHSGLRALPRSGERES